MENINIKINRRTREVNPRQIFIGTDGENLQGNVIFSFEDNFVNGQARLDIEFRDGTKGQITELEKVGETYVMPIKSAITKYSGCMAQLVITEGINEEEIPIFKSLFVGLIVEESINASTPIPEGYTEWIDSANAKLNLIDEKLEDIDEAITETNNLDLDVSKEGKTATVELTKKDNTTKIININDGVSLQFMWDGTSLGVKTDDMQNYVFVELQGPVGPMGPKGEAFQIKKTYATIELMIADYDNMEINDYVMISGNIEQEDNAKLFVKTETEDPTYRWQYLADFSGASGVVGPRGACVTSATINNNGELVMTVE